MSRLTNVAAAATSAANIRVVGPLIKDPVCGKPVTLARHLDLFN